MIRLIIAIILVVVGILFFMKISFAFYERGSAERKLLQKAQEQAQISIQESCKAKYNFEVEIVSTKGQFAKEKQTGQQKLFVKVEGKYKDSVIHFTYDYYENTVKDDFQKNEVKKGIKEYLVHTLALDHFLVNEITVENEDQWQLDFLYDEKKKEQAYQKILPSFTMVGENKGNLGYSKVKEQVQKLFNNQSSSKQNATIVVLKKSTTKFIKSWTWEEFKQKFAPHISYLFHVDKGNILGESFGFYPFTKVGGTGLTKAYYFETSLEKNQLSFTQSNIKSGWKLENKNTLYTKSYQIKWSDDENNDFYMYVPKSLIANWRKKYKEVNVYTYNAQTDYFEKIQVSAAISSDNVVKAELIGEYYIINIKNKQADFFAFTVGK